MYKSLRQRAEHKLKCPKCGGYTVVTKTNYMEVDGKRRRKCKVCGFNFSTIEFWNGKDK